VKPPGTRHATQSGGCPVKGCPTVAGPCGFHGPAYPRGFEKTDRLIRARPHVGADDMQDEAA
jgi:hypothetical protein